MWPWASLLTSLCSNVFINKLGKPLQSCLPPENFVNGKELSIVHHRGFPGGAVVENLPANAGDMGSSPGLGGSHMPWSNWAREPQLLSLRIWSLCSATREAATVKRPAHRDEEWPPLAATGEGPRTETKTQHSHK